MIHKLKLKFIVWFADINKGKYCWADCVGWVYRSWSFKIDKSNGCKKESENGNSCYCGQWVDGKCVATMSEQEIEIMKAEMYPLNQPESNPIF